MVEITQALCKFSVFPRSNYLLELQIGLNSVGARETQTQVTFIVFFWLETVYTGEILLVAVLHRFCGWHQKLFYFKKFEVS